jgi:hypothetical protein
MYNNYKSRKSANPITYFLKEKTYIFIIKTLLRNSPVDTEFPHRLGIPSTRNSIDTEFHRHGIPSTRNSIDTEFRKFFSLPYIQYARLCYIFIITFTGKRTVSRRADLKGLSGEI